MTDRETFYLNDTPILIFEARKPDPTRFDDGDGVPSQPIYVEVFYYSVTDGSLVDIDGETEIPLGVEGDLLYMVAMDEDEDRGALIYVQVPTEVTSVSGRYTMYIRLYYGDMMNPMKITRDVRLVVAEYR